MQLIGLYNIRRKKRISRQKLADDLNLSVEYIKALETTDEETVGNTLIQMFADYFKCSPYEILNDDKGEDLLEKKITIEKIEIPKGVTPLQANTLLFDLLKKYSPVNPDNINQLLSEFKYRLSELEDESPISRLLRSEFNLEDDFEENEEDIDEEDIEDKFGSPLEFRPEIIQNIRKDARTASILYKELRANGLSEHESYMILRIILDT